MADRLCICGEPLPDQRTICNRCQTQTSHHLGDMEAHRAELVTAMARQVRMNAPNDRTSNSLATHWQRVGDMYLDAISAEDVRKLIAACPPARPAADALHAQRQILVQWCRLLHEERGIDLPHRNTVRAMALHLEHHLTDLHTHEAAGELVAEIRDLVEQILQVIDSPVNRLRVTLGACPMNDEEGEPCVGSAIATTRADGKPDTIHCPACRSSWGKEEWHRIGAAIRQREGKPLYDAGAAAEFMRGLGMTA